MYNISYQWNHKYFHNKKKKSFITSASDVTYNLYLGTCKREPDVSEGIQDLPVTFELNFPNDMNTDEVISLIEVL